MNKTLKNNEELIAWLMMNCDRCKENGICATPDGDRVECYTHEDLPEYGTCRYFLRSSLYGLPEDLI